MIGVCLRPMSRPYLPQKGSLINSTLFRKINFNKLRVRYWETLLALQKRRQETTLQKLILFSPLWDIRLIMNLFEIPIQEVAKQVFPQWPIQMVPLEFQRKTLMKPKEMRQSFMKIYSKRSRISSNIVKTSHQTTTLSLQNTDLILKSLKNA
jgi:hypothetical protein